MRAYYNENDAKAAAWLRELIKADLIAQGEVDERSIEDVTANDLRGFTQCHFFAGIGGWSVALRLAGWPDDRSVWTGSCPCQPFSAAGKRKGTSDSRHLWPAWFWLIGESKPPVIFGEQVASKDGIAWLDTVSTDLESEGYSIGPCVLPACGVGAPHLRQRLWFVADSDGRRCEQFNESVGRVQITNESSDVGDSESGGRGVVGNALVERNSGHANGASHTNGFWSDAEWIRCTDNKARPIKPGTFPLAHGIQGRTFKLRGIGNAIVPQVAAQVIEAFMSLTNQTEAKDGTEI